MYFSIATTYRPATDLGYLLAKHPDWVHEVELAFGRPLVLFPAALPQAGEGVRDHYSAALA